MSLQTLYFSLMYKHEIMHTLLLVLKVNDESDELNYPLDQFEDEIRGLNIPNREDRMIQRVKHEKSRYKIKD